MDYSVGAEQTSGIANGASYSKTTISVPEADSMHRVYVKRATLEYGEERRLDLPFGESLTFCARQVVGGLQNSHHPCEAPTAAGQAQTIKAF